MDPFDHKRLGREMKFYHQDDEIGRGLPLWLPNGMAVREELEKLMKELEHKAGYARVSSPHMAREALYEKSGHLSFFSENMYPPIRVGDGEVYRLRPMNCPHHNRIFASDLRSYRDLPLRLAEYGQVYRLEESGALSGLLRVRGLCINDAHIYCRRDQVLEEMKSVMRMHLEVYRILGIDRYHVRLSKSDPADKAKFVDDEASWAWAEGVLREALVALAIPFEEVEGEAAFYGPKIDWQLVSASGREMTASTAQIDFASAERLDLSYVGEGGGRERPVIIHRAPMGSHERMVAFLMELYKGVFPSWLAPVQVRVLPVGDAQVPAAERLVGELRSRMLRAEIDRSGESLGKRVRLALSERVAHIAVIGAKEALDGRVSVRSRGGQRDFSVAEFVAEIERRSRERIRD